MKEQYKKESPILSMLGMGGGGTGTALGGGVAAGPTYSDDVFSTFLYEGTGSGDITINSGIDMAGEGGMVWAKNRSSAVYGGIFDSVRGANKRLRPDSNIAEATAADIVKSFNSNGVTVSADGGTQLNASNDNFVAWMFRKAPGFFDIVTYSGNSQAGRQIPHNLGSSPGMIIIKNLTNSSGADWVVWHKDGGQYEGKLNSNSGFGWEYVTGANSTTFTTTNAGNETNLSGNNYVAYLFASESPVFGTDSDESIIKCGSYNGTGSVGHEINVGFEPQWIMFKNSTHSGNWEIIDMMRGAPVGENNYDGHFLRANTNGAEVTNYSFAPTPTGFTIYNSGGGSNASGSTYIYCAIRRPHKPPTVGTDVLALTSLNTPQDVWTPGFPPDFMLSFRYTGTADRMLSSRLTGNQRAVKTNEPEAEAGTQDYFYYDDPTNTIHQTWFQGSPAAVHYAFRRFPKAIEVVTWTGNGQTRNVPHNLGVAPELMLVKRRSSQDSWAVYHSGSGAGNSTYLNSDGGFTSSSLWNSTTPTATTFRVINDGQVNQNTHKYIGYLFATFPGISKVGQYTGNGSYQTIDCGFSTPARFLLIKKASGSGNWYLWDSVRGFTSGADPHVSLNINTTQLTGNKNYAYPNNAGFGVQQINGTNNPSINDNGATYNFLAIA